MAAVGVSRARVERHRTRKPMRALLLAVILSTAAALVWFSVLERAEPGCQDSGQASAAGGQRLPANALDAVAPAPPQLTRVQVLNANGLRGVATIVDGALGNLGLAPTTRPANDPLYPGFDLSCYGEIRFGAAGQAAARTLSLAVPCAELVRDLRPDAGVDLALGTKFRAMKPNDAARTALIDLAGLGGSGAGSPVSAGPVSAGPSRGGLAAEPEIRPESGPIVNLAAPAVNPELLTLARQVRC